MSWQEIKTQAEADELMNLFGDFHDGCLKEAHLTTDCWVDHDLSMSPGIGPDNSIRMLIQRQWANPAAVELLFEKLHRFHLYPSADGCTSEITRATLIVRGDKIYWSPWSEWSPGHPQRDECTFIAARKLRWRRVEWLGKENRYGPKDEED